MKKILFKKILLDCVVFFLIALFFTSLIIWIFQAVNHLDLMIDDGRDHLTYIKFTLLIFPKIIAKLLPFIFFISFIYVITKYELENELIIFWNFGITKFTLINFFFRASIFLLIIQIILTAFIVPKTQDKARSYLRNSEINLIENFIKARKFNDTVKDLTIYSDTKDENNNYYELYIKSGKNFNNFQITYAKKGRFISDENNQIFDLYDGETISVVNNKITNLKFKRSYLNLDRIETNTITHRKTQEVSTINLIKCFKNIYNKNSIDLTEKLNIENCKSENFVNILKEFHKRFTIPFYIPVLMLICLLMLTKSKESSNYYFFRFKIFLFGLSIIILSELSLRFIEKSFINNFFILTVPLALIILLYLTFYYKLNFKNIKQI